MNLTVGQLKNAIWTHNNGMIPIGGRDIEWYRNELFKLTGETRGYHEDEKQMAKVINFPANKIAKGCWTNG